MAGYFEASGVIGADAGEALKSETENKAEHGMERKQGNKSGGKRAWAIKQNRKHSGAETLEMVT